MGTGVVVESLSLFFGGILLFLFSVSRLNKTIQLAIGSKIREYVKFAVEKKINGLISGIFTTILFQSSSATTLLLVSMVGAGLVSFSQSLPFVLGADIGTTLTAQFIVWKITELSPIILASSFALLFHPDEKLKRIAEITFYFGLLLFGLFLVSRGTDFLREKAVGAFMQKGYFTVFLSSLIFTVIVQSSAIPISIAIVLSEKNLLGLDFALFIVLGANLGTTGTALLGAAVASLDGKKTALAHLIFKAIGVFVFVLFFPFFFWFFEKIPTGLPQKIALSHFFFNVLIAILFYPILGFVAFLFEKLMPAKDEPLPLLPEYLNPHSLKNPETALLCVKKELTRQMLLSKKLAVDSFHFLSDFKRTQKTNIEYLEMVIDNLQTEILKYLWEISSLEMTQRQSRILFAFTSIVHDIERIGDHAVNIAEIAEIKKKMRTFFSDAATKELNIIIERTKSCLEKTLKAIQETTSSELEDLSVEAEATQKAIGSALNNHLERFYCKICRSEAGPLFVDVLTNIEGMLRHIISICEALKRIQE